MTFIIERQKTIRTTNRIEQNALPLVSGNAGATVRVDNEKRNLTLNKI